MPAGLTVQGVGKAYAGVRVLDGIDLDLAPGTVHGLLGHNGAGKSTLVKILAGAEQPDEGTLAIDGRAVTLASPRDALRQGIACVYQELRLIPQLTVAENLFLGRERQERGFTDRRAMRRAADQLLAEHRLALDPGRQVGELSHRDKQMLEVVANLDRNARVLLLDEPTTALDGGDARSLLADVRAVARSQGAAVILVSHKLDEVMEVCDAVTVLSAGRVVHRAERPHLGKASLVAAIVGAPGPAPPGLPGPALPNLAVGPPLLAVDGLRTDRLASVSLEARAGEVLGIWGLAGSGRTRLLRSLYGLERIQGGRITLAGAPVRPRSATEATAMGIAYLTEERKRDGFVPGMSGLRNVVLPTLRRYRGRLPGLVDQAAAGRSAAATLAQLAARGRVDGPIRALSGGNQQKVLFGRIVEQDARLILLDEPTKGVDVGAKRDLHAVVRRLAGPARAILVVSSEEDELLELADRVVVMRAGRCDGVAIATSQLTPAGLRQLAWGIQG